MPQRAIHSFGLGIAALPCLLAVIAGYTLAAFLVAWLTSLATPAARNFAEAFRDIWWAAMIWVVLTACIAILVNNWPVSRIGGRRAMLVYGSIVLVASWIVNGVFFIPHSFAGAVELADLPGRIHAASLAHLPFNSAAAAALVAIFHWLLAAQQMRGATSPLDQLTAANTNRGDCLVVNTGSHALTVPVDSIEWVEAADDYVFLHCASASHICNQRLYELERKLAQAGFVRVHRSALVNSDCVAAVVSRTGSGLHLELSSGRSVAVSRRRQKQVRQALLHGPGGFAKSATWPGVAVLTLLLISTLSPDAARARSNEVSFDADGDPDMFLPVYAVGEANPLYRNDGDWAFTEVAAEAGLVADPLPYSRASAVAQWVDYDSDGNLDLFVGTTGGMIDFLYANDGTGGFQRVVAGRVGLDATYVSDALWADLDNDADLDLVIAVWGSASEIYVNDGKGRFRSVDAGEFGTMVTFASSASVADIEGDGDLDLYLTQWPINEEGGAPNLLYRNDTAGGNWVKIDLEGTASNCSAIGAQIAIAATVDGLQRRQMRLLTGRTSWRSSNSLTQHVGLGAADEIDWIQVKWPSGRIERISGPIQVNRRLKILEGEGLSPLG